jgi:hypothetical protein
MKLFILLLTCLSSCNDSNQIDALQQTINRQQLFINHYSVLEVCCNKIGGHLSRPYLANAGYILCQTQDGGTKVPDLDQCAIDYATRRK